jgi:hypothetical protein
VSLVRLTVPTRVIQFILYTTTVLLLLHFVSFSVQAARRTSHSYVVLYTSARLVRERMDFRLLYNDRWFGRQTARFDDLYRDIYRPHSPITALMLLPLSDLDYAKSRVIWTLFNVVLLAAGSYRLLRELNVKGIALPIMLMLILLYNPLHVNLELGQSYILMFVLLVIAWVGYRRGDNRALGIALGLMLALKTAGVFLWLLLILQRRWSALGWGIVTVGIFALISLPFVRLEAWFAYFSTVSYFNGQPFLAVTAYQTHTSLFSHLFTYDAQWNATPAFEAPVLASVLTLATTAVLVGLSIVVEVRRTLRKQPANNDLIFAIFVIVSVLIVPLALDYHYMILLFPIIILATQKWSSKTSWLILALGIGLISTAIFYRQPALSVGWMALLAYPKLYGALLLWGLALWQNHRLTSAKTDF